MNMVTSLGRSARVLGTVVAAVSIIALGAPHFPLGNAGIVASAATHAKVPAAPVAKAATSIGTGHASGTVATHTSAVGHPQSAHPGLHVNLSESLSNVCPINLGPALSCSGQSRSRPVSKVASPDLVAAPHPVASPDLMAAPTCTKQQLATGVGFNDTAACVKAIQRLLNGHGSKLVVDGQFGRATRAAVIAFQKSKALTPDGLVGVNTWAALNR